MNLDVEGLVAVVTGAASGVGLGVTEALLDRGARVVLADIDAALLGEEVARLSALGADVHGVVVDVADQTSVDALRDAAYERYGVVHVVLNNAGVQSKGPTWEQPLEAWHRLFGVNLWGPIHGIRSFVPCMLSSGAPGHVLITASMASINPMPRIAPYITSKHAVLGLADSLRLDLELAGAPISVSTILPGLVETRMHPGEGMVPRLLGDVVVAGIEADLPYIFTNPYDTERVETRMRALLDARVVE